MSFFFLGEAGRFSALFFFFFFAKKQTKNAPPPSGRERRVRTACTPSVPHRASFSSSSRRISARTPVRAWCVAGSRGEGRAAARKRKRKKQTTFSLFHFLPTKSTTQRNGRHFPERGEKKSVEFLFPPHHKACSRASRRPGRSHSHEPTATATPHVLLARASSTRRRPLDAAHFQRWSSPRLTPRRW